jgi:hypothetical protein
MKTLRITAAVLMTVAAVATVTTPPQKDMQGTVILSGGSSPKPLCAPWENCDWRK